MKKVLEPTTLIQAQKGSQIRKSVRKFLPICGIFSSLLYVCTDILGTMRWEGYNFTSQCVSELIAIDAPSRALVMPLFEMYAVLVIVFGLGVWGIMSRKRALRITGLLLAGSESIGIVITVFFPMHLRGVLGTMSDIMHKNLTGIHVLLILLSIGFGAATQGKRFRYYSIGTFLLQVTFGVLAAMYVPKIEAGLPTPWLGIVERILIYSYELWVLVLAVSLWRGEMKNEEKEEIGVRK